MIEMEELFKDVGDLSVVTKLADHVVEVRNLWVMFILLLTCLDPYFELGLKLKPLPIANKHKTVADSNISI